MSSQHTIGTLREQQLHASLKQWLAQPGDAFEQKVDGYHIDILRGNLLIEIQTANFSMIRKKLTKLLENHSVLLVHPIPETKWIVRTTKRKKQLTRRRSPKRGRIEHIFDELLYIPEIAKHPNFQLQVLLTQQEEIWRDDGRGSWRRRHWSVTDSRLLEVVGEAEFSGVNDYLALIPKSLSAPFTHRQLAEALGAHIRLSMRMSYCLRKMGLLEVAGKEGRSLLLAPGISADTISAA
ncbi:MAG: hypothetical protein M1347_04520 [Chloroflexi bacterium]|nr:hypothetical protein [Chloroflexota bacterium]